jgi:hypothetical protein
MYHVEPTKKPTSAPLLRRASSVPGFAVSLVHVLKLTRLQNRIIFGKHLSKGGNKHGDNPSMSGGRRRRIKPRYLCLDVPVFCLSGCLFDKTISLSENAWQQCRGDHATGDSEPQHGLTRSRPAVVAPRIRRSLPTGSRPKSECGD